MKTSIYLSHLLLACVLLTACGKTKADAGSAAEKEIKTNKDEVTLSPDQEAAAMIETQAAVISQDPELLRAKGRIALPDDHTWRVGVRTVALIVDAYAGLCE